MPCRRRPAGLAGSYCRKRAHASVEFEGEQHLRLLVRYVLEIPYVAGTDPAPPAELTTAFAHLERAWPDF